MFVCCKLKSRESVADCCKPMLWAASNRKEVDVFVVYTDQRGGGAPGGAGAGDPMTPIKALQRYRDEMNRHNTRFVFY